MYTILPDVSPPPTGRAAAGVPPIRLADADELSVAFVNLERLFDTTDDRDVAHVALTEAAFQRRLAKAALYIRQSLRLPDIIAVAEVENLGTLQTLASVVNSEARGSGLPDPEDEAYSRKATIRRHRRWRTRQTYACGSTGVSAGREG